MKSIRRGVPKIRDGLKFSETLAERGEAIDQAALVCVENPGLSGASGILKNVKSGSAWNCVSGKSGSGPSFEINSSAANGPARPSAARAPMDQ